jgi:hypothetical protein
MALTVPKQLSGLIDETDASQQPIDFLGLAGRMSAALANVGTLPIEERRGAFAEIDALRFQPPHGQRYPWGIYWTPLGSGTMQDGTEFHSPDIANVDDEVLAHWAARSEAAKHPACRARFADLAWEIGRHLKHSQAKNGQPTASIGTQVQVALAHRAVDSYLKSIAKNLFGDEYDAWKFLDRAIELSIGINDPARINKAKQELFAYYTQSASGQKPMWWRFDQITWDKAKGLNLTDGEKQQIIDALEKVLTVSSDHSDTQRFNPHDAMSAADSLARRREQRSEPDEAKRAIKTAALAFEEAARLANGLTAIAWLEDLIPRYRNLGMADDAARVERTIRERAGDAKGEMKHIEVPITIPQSEMDDWVNRVLGNSIEDAFGRIAMGSMIKKDATENSLRQMLKDAPLSAMISTSIMGPDGFTAATIGSLENDIEGRSIQHAADQFNWRAPWLYMALNGAKERYSFDTDKVIECATRYGWFSSEREPLLRTGINAWFADDPVKAIHILVPQIEAALRDVLAALGAPVRKPDPDLGGFQVIGMGQVLNHAMFIERMPADVRFHFRALYSDARGINLRNHLAHGLVHPGLLGMGVANWVMHSVLLIGMIRVQPRTSTT